MERGLLARLWFVAFTVLFACWALLPTYLGKDQMPGVPGGLLFAEIATHGVQFTRNSALW